MKSLLNAAAFAGIVIAMPLTASAAETLHAQGVFQGAEGHEGTGTASLTISETGETTLKLTDFRTTPGPDLKVWLVAAGNITNSGDVKDSQWLSLGKLQSEKGDQTYAIPDGTDLSAYQSAIIWCEAFSVLFAAADLSPAP